MAGRSDKDYATLKRELLRYGRLFEDPDFPASAYSIKRDGKVSYSTRWRRPGEIIHNPKFIIDGSTRFDINQGELGDCWFLAGAACMAISNRKLFERCVPHDQTFDQDYVGLFRFNFWHFDRWTEVVIDDRLPTRNGQLIYCHNRDPQQRNEFWAALMEKAYAKLFQCYENIHGGHIGNALVDMTGGISEYIDLNESELPPAFFDILFNTMKMNSMMGSAIPSDRLGETQRPNGLYEGHAYSITYIMKAKIHGKQYKFLRLRNPWGKGEWIGAWGDRSREMLGLSEDDRKKLGFYPKLDGEFWMTYEDWVDNFEKLNICHLYPDAISSEVAKDTKKKKVPTATLR